MNSRHLIIFAALTLLAAGCVRTRSISDSGYNSGCFTGPTTYNRELSELDVLGIDPVKAVSETDIANALKAQQNIHLRPGSPILLIQSGAMFPDGAMVQELSQRFTVVPFSGLAQIEDAPQYRTYYTGRRHETIAVSEERAKKPAGSYLAPLRLAAARGGAETIVCYWGILESANEHEVTKTVSWIPVVSWVVPDEKQHMRIRLKMAVIDVPTGRWSLLSPEPIEDKAWSTSPRREAVDQKQVEKLKSKAYAAAVQELVKRYAAL